MALTIQQEASAVTALLAENPNETFLTALRMDPKALNKAKAREHLLDLSSKILSVHTELQKLADTLDERVGTLLDAHEKDFFLAYKTHMLSVQKEFKSLKLKADEHETKSRRQAKIQSLEKELRWFMKEALRLDELCKNYLGEMERWKRLADQLDDDRTFLEDQIKKSKAQNRALRLSVERAQQHAYEALAASSTLTSQSQTQTAGTAESQEAIAGGGSTGSNVPPALEDGSTMVVSAGEAGGNHQHMPEKMAERYRKTIKNLTSLVQAEKRKVQKLDITLANTPQPKVLEEYFVQCIADAKEDVFQRRSQLANSGLRAPDQIELSDFTSYDKRTVVDLLFRNPELLRLLEKKMDELGQKVEGSG